MFNDLKTDLSELVHLSRDALHVHLGLAVFFLAMVVLRKSPKSLVPWLCVLGLEVINELFDAAHWRNGTLSFGFSGSLKDVVNTLLWPTVIVVMARYTRLLTR